MTKLMGILNVTPDSFADQERYFNADAAIARGKEIYDEGADILDIGGESTRPGAIPVDEATELERVIPVITSLHKVIPIPISIDTRKPRVAEAAIKAGASLINDVNGFSDPNMVELAVSCNVDICVMHMQGDPTTMQNNPSYQEGIIPHLIQFFEKRVDTLIKRGVNAKHIILDPGIGFGKTIDDNVEILQNLPRLRSLGFPLLLGVSRKSFMSKILKKKPSDLLPATLAVNTLLIMTNVDIIRVHDIREHRDIINLLKHFQE